MEWKQKIKVLVGVAKVAVTTEYTNVIKVPSR